MTRQHLTRFKDQFTEWQNDFGLKEYTVSFKTKKFKDRFAEIEVNAEGCIATVWVNESEKWYNWLIDTVAKHECIHLLLGRFAELASGRYVNEDELSAEEERVVCVLEKVL